MIQPMQVTETLSEGLKRGFTVVVPGAEIEARRTARLTDLGKTLRLPGFRPGKVPLPIVRQRYGMAVTAEVLEESVNQATQQVLSERNLRPAQTPKIDLLNVDTGAGPVNDLEFKVEFEALPEIPLPDFSQLSLTRLKGEVQPELIEKELEAIAQRNRTPIEITAEELGDRGAAPGEVLTVDFVGKLEGVPFPNGTGTDTNVEVGEDTGFIPGFANQLEGMRPGERRTIEVTFPENYGNKELAGKPATFDITAKKISRYVVPEVNDELAQRLAFDKLDELREMIQRRLQRELDGLSRMRLKRELLDALAQQVQFDVPQGLVDADFNEIWQRLEAERKQGRLDDDDKGKDEETLRADYRAIAERRVKLGLVLAEIGRANGISVTEEEVARARRAEASRYPGQERQLMELFAKNPEMSNMLRGPLLEEKIVDHMLGLAQVTERAATREELEQDPPLPTLGASESPTGASSDGADASTEGNGESGTTETSESEGT
jgi:trigger factor